MQCPRFTTFIRQYSQAAHAQNNPLHLKTGKRDSFQLISFPEALPLAASQSSYANKLFARQPRFVTSVFDMKQLPPGSLPEIAFTGRSNAGKSTLINRLFNTHKLVKTSGKPGHTRSLNFFEIPGHLRLVDMPGYGFRSREEWGDLILNYLRQRQQLKRLFIVIDSVAGIKDTDRQLMSLLDQQPLSYQIVLTKRDRLTSTAFQTAKQNIEHELAQNAICCFPELVATGIPRKGKSDGDQVAKDITRVRWAVLSAAGIVPPSDPMTRCAP